MCFGFLPGGGGEGGGAAATTKALRMKNVWARGTTATLQNVRERKETKDAGAPEEEEGGGDGVVVRRFLSQCAISSLSAFCGHLTSCKMVPRSFRSRESLEPVAPIKMADLFPLPPATRRFSPKRKHRVARFGVKAGSDAMLRNFTISRGDLNNSCALN